MTLTVKAVRVSGFVLLVKFTDDHEIVTCRNTDGWSPSNAIATCSLRKGDEEAALYQSPYQHPRNTDSRNGFVRLAPGYDIDRVVEYWLEADRYIRERVDEAGGLAELRQSDSDMCEAFLLVSHGHQDIEDVKSGRVEVHTESATKS